MAETKKQLFDYTEESIKSLDWKEHIRLRPGMYIGKLGDGSSPDDGIYVLVKEVIDNCIDEYTMGYGKTVEIKIEGKTVTVRDFGRGIPLGKVVDVVSKINTGAKYDSKVFQKSVGLNGVGTKAVNALSSFFKVASHREGKVKEADVAQTVFLNHQNIEQFVDVKTAHFVVSPELKSPMSSNAAAFADKAAADSKAAEVAGKVLDWPTLFNAL